MIKWRKAAAVAVAMLTMSGLAVATSTSSTSALVFGTSSISGTVTGPAGTPLFFAQVFSFQFDGTNWVPGAASNFTGFDGKYSISGLPDGVPLEFEVVDQFDQSLAPQWFDHAADQATATQVTLAPSEARVLDVQLQKAPGVIGTVTAADGTPLDANVTIFSPSTGASFFGQALGGAFNIVVPAGTYVVYAATQAFPPDQYAPEYYGQSYSLTGATPVVVTGSADVTGIDITLSPGAVVTGRILDQAGNPIPQGLVVMLNLNGPFGFDEFAHNAGVGPDGTYRLQGIPTGTFTYDFSDGTPSGLASADVDLSTVVGETLHHDITLSRGQFGVIVGLDASGVMSNQVPGNAPQVCPPDPTAPTPTCAIGGLGVGMNPNPTGDGWIVGPLAEGSYFTQLRSTFDGSLGTAVSLPPVLSPGFSCTVLFPGVPGEGSCQPAAALPVGTVSGHVTGPDGVGLAGVEVSAEYKGGPLTNTVPSAVFTDVNGDYSMPNTWTGSYRIRFTPPIGRSDLTSVWWTSAGSVSAFAAGEALTVTDGATLSGIDGQIEATAIGSIAVTTNGQPVASPSGLNAEFCPAPATPNPFVFQCTDGSPPVASSFDGTGFPSVGLPAGTWVGQVVGFTFFPVFGQVSGAPTTFTLKGGDTFACSLDTLPAGPSSCTVAGSAPPDSTPPVITPSVSPATPDGNNGWYRSDVSVHFQVDEPDSPLSLTTNGCGDVSVTADQPATTYSCTASSAGGNAGPVDVTIQRDATAPGVAWSGGIADGQSFVFGSLPAAPTCAATDALSGPNDCTVQGYSTAVGTHTLLATATDQAGNMASASITYTVTPYRLAGFRAPVRSVPFVNFLDSGDDIRFQWQVFAGATELKTTGVVSSFTATPASCTSFIPSGSAVDLTVGNPVTRDLRRGVFSLKWEPTRRQRGCWVVTMTTDDGSSLTARFRVK